ncbi:GntR family transcriptional regulator [Carboxylicivirga sp. A043]|uniref:GntR family transcriptional regulator n=1 Tax=Carboxylicivirga litoralis TaxID=2816963 RepID=UPI0021CB196F|nr:GntR family transcriptional regulator [Carboxylicivirga sp. A043]MCU4157016.1 GntR family transcriptional regulator [Carboxylicivirga sp. A043]
MIKFTINSHSEIPKFQQLVDTVVNALAENKLHEGDQLPSVNVICQTYKLSRDTVFKAYGILKEQGVIESVPNKGYFVAKEGRKVFLFLDTFKAYKEVLYGEFVRNLNKDTIADVHFHHYNIELFKKLINDSRGRYSKYIIMPFDHPEVAKIVSTLPADKTLIIDWNTNIKHFNNKLYQDFSEPVFEALYEADHLINKYKRKIMVYPTYTNHPVITADRFKDYCDNKEYEHLRLTNEEELSVRAGDMYFCVSDRMLGHILEQCKERKLEPGVDVGILSYNETPMKKFIYKGISVISTDFKLMGQKAASFASSDIEMDYCVPTKIFFRESL